MNVFNSDSDLIRERVEDGSVKTFIERVAPTAFNRSLTAAATGKASIAALWEHDKKAHLGSTRGGKLSLEADDRGLRFSLDATRLSPAQIDTIRDGDAGMSFGFKLLNATWGRRDDGFAERTVHDLILDEVSITTNPAYAASSAAIRSLEEWEAEERSAAEEEVATEESTEVVEDTSSVDARKKMIDLRLKHPRD